MSENPSQVDTRSNRKNSQKKEAMIACREAVKDPTSFREMIDSSERNEWRTAMEDEIASLTKHNVWSLEVLPKGKHAISGRWVFKTKTCGKKKARYVARGYSQVEGIDFFETFAPVARTETVCVLLSVAASRNWDIKQFDVRTAFLYGPLDEEVFMAQPEGFDDGSARVCRLRKGLYGLKQAPRQWNGTFHKFLSEFGFVRSNEDPCLYRLNSGGDVLYLCLYVDDGLVFSSSNWMRDVFMEKLARKFEITSSDPDTYVGMEIQRDRDKGIITISQKSYITRVLQRFGMSDSNPITTPSDPTMKLSKDMPSTQEEDGKGNRFPYREAIGCLNYIAVVSRPDITFAVNKAAKFCENPKSAHWSAVKRILRYLKGTIDVGISYGVKKDHSLVGFCDSDFAGDVDTRRSTTGFVFMINGGPVSWSSTTQSTTALASTEAEYMALTDAMKEVLWLRRLLEFVGLQQDDPTLLRVDNQGAIALSRNPEFHKRSKHIAVKYHRIREEQEEGNLRLEYVESTNQAADFLTKSLSGPAVKRARDMIGLTTSIERRCSETLSSM